MDFTPGSENRKILNQEFNQEKYKEFRDWYTYGQLVSIVTDEGLSLCNDLKLQYQMKQQNLTGRKELGEFCDQFAYEPGIKYPAKTRKISHNIFIQK